MATPSLSFASDRGGVALERRVVPTGADRAVLEQSFRGTGICTLVTHRAFTWSIVEVRSGSLAFDLAGGPVEAPPRFELVVPPRSILRMRFEQAEVWSQGTAGFARATGASPCLWPARRTTLDFAQLDPANLPAQALRTELDADRSVGRTIVTARRALHEGLGRGAPVLRAASELGVRRETLSRRFHAAYGIAPKAYCHRARLFDAVIRLLEGFSVIDAAFDSGFDDLSRFYANFRSLIGSTPARYRRAGHEARRQVDPRSVA